MRAMGNPATTSRCLLLNVPLRLHRPGKGDARRQIALSQVLGQGVKNQVAEFLGREIQGLRGFISSRRTKIAAHVLTQPFE